MKVALIHADFEKRGGTIVGPDRFSEDELEIARQHEVQIGQKMSFTTNSEYLANYCNHCDSFVGSFYIFANYFKPASQGKLSSKRISLAS